MIVNPIFTSTFWRELFRLCGTKLIISSAYHPQTDEQMEVVNRTIEMNLCCFVGHQPRKWVEWLPWAITHLFTPPWAPVHFG